MSCRRRVLPLTRTCDVARRPQRVDPLVRVAGVHVHLVVLLEPVVDLVPVERDVAGDVGAPVQWRRDSPTPRCRCAPVTDDDRPVLGVALARAVASSDRWARADRNGRRPSGSSTRGGGRSRRGRSNDRLSAITTPSTNTRNAGDGSVRGAPAPVPASCRWPVSDRLCGRRWSRCRCSCRARATTNVSIAVAQRRAASSPIRSSRSAVDRRCADVLGQRCERSNATIGSSGRPGSAVTHGERNRQLAEMLDRRHESALRRGIGSRVDIATRSSPSSFDDASSRRRGGG